MNITEPARELVVESEYDVIVGGGGIAGVSAALAAARNGASTVLLEKESILGGLATAGNVIKYLPLCDGMGNQVIGGISEELLHLSVKHVSKPEPNAKYYPAAECWKEGGDISLRTKSRYQVDFPPAQFALDMEEELLSAGVDILYDTRICSATTSNGKVSHIIVENKSGRFALNCKAVVDATGDADICYLAGAKTASLETNVRCGWFYHYNGDKLDLAPYTQPYLPTLERSSKESMYFRGDDGRQVSSHITESRKVIRSKLNELREKQANKDVLATSIPVIATMRATRRLDNSFVLTEDCMHQWYEDTVALTGDWRKAGPVYAIPLRALRSDQITNLYSAGRCISSSGSAWDATRAIPTCAVTAEAAATAAALQCRGVTDIRKIQQTLISKGAIIEPGLVNQK